MSQLNNTQQASFFEYSIFNSTIAQISTSLWIFGAGMCLYLIKKKMTGLNILIKSILYTMTGQYFVMSIIGFVCTHLLTVWHLRNFTICMVYGMTRLISRFGNLTSLALISQVRYFIALKVSQSKAYR